MSDDFSFPSLVRQQTFWYGNSSPTLAMRELLVLSKDTSLPNPLHTSQWLTGISEIMEGSKEPGQCMHHHRYTHVDTWTHTLDKDTVTAVATQMSTDKALSPADLTFTSHTDGHLLFFLSWQRLEFTSVAHTPHSPSSQTHTFVVSPSIGTTSAPVAGD